MQVVAGDLVIADSVAAAQLDGGIRLDGVVVATAADVAAARYEITDVVLPLPGADILLPENRIGELLRQFLSYDGTAGVFPYNP